jgi:hypothetical protein
MTQFIKTKVKGEDRVVNLSLIYAVIESIQCIKITKKGCDFIFEQDIVDTSFTIDEVLETIQELWRITNSKASWVEGNDIVSFFAEQLFKNQLK